MTVWNGEQFLEWMGGALIRKIDRASSLPDSVRLDDSVRIAGFDKNDVLSILDCGTVCPIGEYLDRGLNLYAFDHRRHSLHFALRRLIDCSVPSLHQNYLLGANASTQVRLSDAYSVLKLVKLMPQGTSVFLKDVYLLLQNDFEQMWRIRLHECRQNAVWTESDAFLALTKLAKTMFPEARNHFLSYGLIVCSDFNIHGVSSPLYIAEG